MSKQNRESIPDKEITVRIGDPSLLLLKHALILYKPKSAETPDAFTDV